MFERTKIATQRLATNNGNFYCLVTLIVYGLAVYLPNILRYDYPLGCAGLYLTMADHLYENNFSLPVNVPFYGPGGIPLAYPPAGIYLTALISRIFKFPVIPYLKIFPMIWGISSLVILYFLFAKLQRHKWLACFTAILVATSYTIYYYQLTAGGIVRGMAFMFSMLAILLTYHVLEEKHNVWVYFLASVSVGLTLLTHFTYALFTIISIAVFSSSKNIQRLLKGGIIITGGFLVAAPWIIFMCKNYGFDIFQSALVSHGNLSIIYSPNALIAILDRLLTNLALIILDSPGLAFLALVGIIFEAQKKRLRFVIWFILTVFFVSEGYRFLVVIAGLFAGFAFRPFLSSSLTGLKNNLTVKWFVILTALGIWGFNAYYTISSIFVMQPSLKTETYMIKNWAEEHTKPEDIFMTLLDEDTAEWFPYVIQRMPAIGYWGSEWNGRFTQENPLFFEALSCVSNNTYTCLKQFMLDYQLSPQYLITPGSEKYREFNENASRDPEVRLVFKGTDFLVWELIKTK